MFSHNKRSVISIPTKQSTEPVHQILVGLLTFSAYFRILLIPCTSATESGIDSSATTKYPGAEVKTGPAASGREIPVEEGGDISARGRLDVYFNDSETKHCLYEYSGRRETKILKAQEGLKPNSGCMLRPTLVTIMLRAM